MSFSPERLALLLKQKNITQKKLAQLTDVTEAVVSKYMKGNCNPKASALISIANALDCTVDYLLGLSDISNKNELTPEIKSIQRTRQSLSQKDKIKYDTMLKLSALSIEEAFKDNE